MILSEKTKITGRDPDCDGDDGSCISSLSFYDDFPKLYFAVRRGRLVENSVFLSWDSARMHIVDYPEAEYIATPTLRQAHSYTNGFGAFGSCGAGAGDDAKKKDYSSRVSSSSCGDSNKERLSERTVRDHRQSVTRTKTVRNKEERDITANSNSNLTSTQSRRISQKTRKKKKKSKSLRSLLLEYYELSYRYFKINGDGRNEPQDQKPPPISTFLEDRNVDKKKYRLFAKHWQRSGLLMICHDEKPLEDAERKYDAWIRERKIEYGGGDILDVAKPKDRSTNGKADAVAVSKTTSPIDTNRKNNNSKSKSKTLESKNKAAVDIPSSTKFSTDSRDSMTKKRKRTPPITPSPSKISKSVEKFKENSKKASVNTDGDGNGDVADNNANDNANTLPVLPVLKSTTIACSSQNKKATRREKGAITRAMTSISKSTSNDDDDDEIDKDWDEMYAKLKAFHQQFGHCKVPKTHCQKLWYWTQYNRRRMKPETVRSGARALTLREDNLLNELNFDPVYKKIADEFNKYLGLRVAKLFEVKVPDNVGQGKNGENPKVSRTVQKPFFGTVGRISSFCNRYLRIYYDDGDSEDFDHEGLLKGLRLYRKFDHLDTNPGVVRGTDRSPVAFAVQKTTNQKIENQQMNSIFTQPVAATSNLSEPAALKNTQSMKSNNKTKNAYSLHDIFTETPNQGNPVASLRLAAPRKQSIASAPTVFPHTNMSTDRILWSSAVARSVGINNVNNIHRNPQVNNTLDALIQANNAYRTQQSALQNYYNQTAFAKAYLGQRGNLPAVNSIIQHRNVDAALSPITRAIFRNETMGRMTRNNKSAIANGSSNANGIAIINTNAIGTNNANKNFQVNANTNTTTSGNERVPNSCNNGMSNDDSSDDEVEVIETLTPYEPNPAILAGLQGEIGDNNGVDPNSEQE